MQRLNIDSLEHSIYRLLNLTCSLWKYVLINFLNINKITEKHHNIIYLNLVSYGLILSFFIQIELFSTLWIFFKVLTTFFLSIYEHTGSSWKNLIKLALARAVFRTIFYRTGIATHWEDPARNLVGCVGLVRTSKFFVVIDELDEDGDRCFRGLKYWKCIRTKHVSGDGGFALFRRLG